MDYASVPTYFGDRTYDVTRFDMLHLPATCIAGGQHFAAADSDDTVRDQNVVVRKYDDVAETRRPMR